MKEKSFKIIFYSIIICSLIMVFLIGTNAGDRMQYKRIGKTDFYLVESFASSPEGKPLPRIHRLVDNCYVGLSVNGFPKDIFLDKDYILLKCTDASGKGYTNFCIIKQNVQNDLNPTLTLRFFFENFLIDYQLVKRRKWPKFQCRTQRFGTFFLSLRHEFHLPDTLQPRYRRDGEVLSSEGVLPQCERPCLHAHPA